MPSSKPAPRPSAPSAPARGSRPKIMGIINATPDSFYPGSRAFSPAEARDLARRLRDEGADILDIGGQSTRPGSDPVDEAEELRRVIPAVEAASRLGLPVSIDTDKAAVARWAREAGASILNDVSALRNDPRMAEEAAAFDAVILMHRGGESPKTMQENPHYENVVRDVAAFFRQRLDFFFSRGGRRSSVLIDPGIGFGKTLEHNLILLKRLKEFSTLAPVVVGASRKSFLSRLSPDEGPQDRLAGSLAVTCWAAARGAAVVRAHDVLATQRALETWSALESAG